MTRLNFYNTYIDYEVKNGVLSYQGYWLSVKKFINHSFTKGTNCYTKDKRNFKSIKAEVIKVLDTTIHVRNENSKSIKKYSIEEFIQMNYTLDTLLRLEYKGKGFYTNWTAFWNDLPQDQKDIYEAQVKRNKDQKGYKPNPEESFRYRVSSEWKFAFRGYDQLFNWFHLDELSIFLRNGVEIVYLQEMVDYCDTVGSFEQIMYTKSPEAINHLCSHNSF